jgi:hypothetical protein
MYERCHGMDGSYLQDTVAFWRYRTGKSTSYLSHWTSGARTALRRFCQVDSFMVPWSYCLRSKRLLCFMFISLISPDTTWLLCVPPVAWSSARGDLALEPILHCLTEALQG